MRTLFWWRESSCLPCFTVRGDSRPDFSTGAAGPPTSRCLSAEGGKVFKHGSHAWLAATTPPEGSSLGAVTTSSKLAPLFQRSAAWWLVLYVNETTIELDDSCLGKANPDILSPEVTVLWSNHDAVTVPGLPTVAGTNSNRLPRRTIEKERRWQ